MNILIVRPQNAPRAYGVAAEIFADLCFAVTGKRPETVTDSAAKAWVPGDSSVKLAIIGADDVNLLSREALPDGLSIRYGTDDYAVKTETLRGHAALLLCGGRGRSTLYAVYRYFEKIVGCRWFWDGDRIPTLDSLPFEKIDFTERTKYLYRGTRYFAHRGLHRFQAEHWDLSDWQREIDWLLKMRLNLFMLRIGQDDLFQKAFPETVEYPSAKKKLPEAGDGFDDRTLFWDLRYRGDLRKRLLAYAKERDLLTPEDCGTMTHWYSRTPLQFLENMRPTLLSQPNGTNYAQATGLAWDIREKRNLDLYFKLTETHIREYGQTGLFHTIGLAERAFSDNRAENMRLKRLFYRLLTRRLREEYPNSKLLLASWDLWMFYCPEEVRELLAELDPEQVILFDYTSDSARKSNFAAWGVEHAFPWVFGIFHAYQPSNEIRGDYERIIERLNRTKDDPMCKGIVFWPELSHGDPFMTVFFAKNAWEVSEKTIERQLEEFCTARYPAQDAGELLAVWRVVLPLGKLMSWSRYEEVTPWAETDVFCRAPYMLTFEKPDAHYEDYLAPLRDAKADAADALEKLAPLVGTADEMTVRDAYDLARTVLTRYLNAGCLSIEKNYVAGKNVNRLMEQTLSLLALYTRFLETHADYSLADTLVKLQTAAPVNPVFAETLKKNCDNLYCRSCVAECARGLYLPELEALFAMLREGKYDRRGLLAFCEENRLAFEKTPLRPFVPKENAGTLLRDAAKVLRGMEF